MDTRGAIDLARQVAAGQDQVLARPQALAVGMTPSAWSHQLAHHWPPLLAGTAFVRDVESEPGPRAWGRSALLRAGDGGRLCLGSALRVLDIEGCPPDDPEHVLLGRPATRHQCSGVRFHWDACATAYHRDLGGLPVTAPVYAVYQALRRWDRDQAVSVLDSALFRRRLVAAELRQLRTSPLPAARRAWIDLADGKAESPLETRTRLMFGDHGLAGFEPQVWIDVPGFGRVRVDFKRGRVIVEADGRGPHDGTTSATADRLRQEALEALGFIIVRVTWWDVVYAREATVARILRAIARAELAQFAS